MDSRISRSDSASEWRERAKRVTPGGSQTRSKRDLFEAPVALTGASGSRTWDAWEWVGPTYLDWISALCAISLGHGHPEVDEAVIQQIRDHGTCLSLPSRLEVTVAEKLLETLNWGEQVRWVKTGSEATGAAMLIARAATHRQIILNIGYHGWHPGHQENALGDVIGIEWGNLDKLKWCMAVDVAAVLLEPMRDEEPPAGYLQGIRDLCTEHGALLIMDEVVTGFRWAIGGARELYGIDPDLACYGKALGNGYPISAVVGRERHMRFADRVSSTFGGELVGLAAAGAVLDLYRREPVIEHLWCIGQQLKDGLGLIGYPCYPRFPEQPKEKAALLASRGILIHPAKGTFCPTYAHTSEDVKKTVEALG